MAEVQPGTHFPKPPPPPIKTAIEGWRKSREREREREAEIDGACVTQDQSDLGISNDAGHYLCDFIYYSSLAHLYKQRRPRKVVFLHVPSSAADKFVTQGRELVLGLVRAIAESETRDGFRPEQRTGMGD